MNSRKVCLIWFAGALAAVLLGSQRTSALLMSRPWGEMADFELKADDVVCAGTIVGHRALTVSPRWRSDYGWIPVAEPQEIEFLVDSVISGPGEARGRVITVRCAGVGDGRGKLDVTKTVGARRCLLYLISQGDPGAAYEIVDGSKFLLLGSRPEKADFEELTPSERLGLEVENAIVCEDPAVAIAAMRSAARGPMNPVTRTQVVRALTARKSAKDVDLASEAVAALLRLGDKQTLYELKALLDQWDKNKDLEGAANKVREGLASVRDTAGVPFLVELSVHTNAQIRTSALRALRYIRSKDAVAALARSIDEPNLELRYNSIMGLAYQTGRLNPQWTTNFKSFSKDPVELTAKWQAWWQETNKAPYPSVEQVISKAEQKRRRTREEAQETLRKNWKN